MGYRQMCEYAYARNGDDGVRSLVDDPGRYADDIAGPYGKVIHVPRAYGAKIMAWEFEIPNDPSWML